MDREISKVQSQVSIQCHEHLNQSLRRRIDALPIRELRQILEEHARAAEAQQRQFTEQEVKMSVIPRLEGKIDAVEVLSKMHLAAAGCAPAEAQLIKSVEERLSEQSEHGRILQRSLHQFMEEAECQMGKITERAEFELAKGLHRLEDAFVLMNDHLMNDHLHQGAEKVETLAADIKKAQDSVEVLKQATEDMVCHIQNRLNMLDKRVDVLSITELTPTEYMTTASPSKACPGG